MPIPIDQIQGVVLSGGQGRRMGGQDKGLVTFDGMPLARRAAQRLTPSVNNVMISANRHLEQYRSWGYATVSDHVAAIKCEAEPNRIEATDTTSSQFDGPLAGVLSALRASTLPYVAFVPCDVPYFPVDIVHTLSIALSKSRAQTAHDAARVAMPYMPRIDGQQHVEPMFMLMHIDAIHSLEQYFLDGGRKVTAWAAKAGLAVAPIHSTDATCFADVDSMEELLQLQAKQQ